MPRPRIPEDQRMVSFGIRMTPLQWERLCSVSETDGLPRQEHVRRALDEYLSRLYVEE